MYSYQNFDISNYEKYGGQAMGKRIDLKEKPSKRSAMWMLSNESKVPMLSDHLKHTAGQKNPLLTRDEKVSRKCNNGIGDWFNQSHLQKRLSGDNKGKVSPFLAHVLSDSSRLGLYQPLDANQRAMKEVSHPTGSNNDQAR